MSGRAGVGDPVPARAEAPAGRGAATAAAEPQTMFHRIWQAHRVGERDDGRELIYVDRHVVHELHGPHAFARLARSGRKVRRADLTFTVQDHTVVSHADRRSDGGDVEFLEAMRDGSREHGIRLFDINDRDQGISHVMAPELGIVLPGMTYASPDSHACTVGGIGALPFASGTSDLTHVLATQVVAAKRPKSMRITLDGELQAYVGPKDVIMRIVADQGSAGARGYAVEYAGDVVSRLSVEGRLTLCNMSIEMGARTSLVGIDATTIDWVLDRPWAPTGQDWADAMSWWETLATDPDARFDVEASLACDDLEPQVSWGTDASHVVGVSGVVPEPDHDDERRRRSAEQALRYMDLRPGTPVQGLPVDRVFIGSCTNGRLSDLELAAQIVRGRRVADNVQALVVPGSTTVRRQAEERGLDEVFIGSGFRWGQSGCSMCTGHNGDRAAPGERTLSTTNRSFENRQGPGVRTHLASPATVAASAITGVITDVRELMGVR